MPAISAVVEKNRMVRQVRCLQSGRHLSCVQRIAVLVQITRDKHRGGIANAITDVVVRRVTQQRSEVICSLSSPELVFPYVCVIEEVITEHVEHRHHADNCAKQLWPLRHRRTYEQPGIGAAENGEFADLSSPSFKEPFRSSDEVIERHLAIAPLRGFVPRSTKFRASANARQGK